MAKSNAFLISLGMTSIIIGVLALIIDPFGAFVDGLFNWASSVNEEIGSIILIAFGIFFFLLAMALERFR